MVQGERGGADQVELDDVAAQDGVVTIAEQGEEIGVSHNGRLLNGGIAVEADAAVDVFGGLGAGVGACHSSAAVRDEPDLAVLEIDGGVGSGVGRSGVNGSLRSVEGVQHELELRSRCVAQSGGVFEVDPGVVDGGVSIDAGREQNGRGLLREGGLLLGMAMPIDVEDEQADDDGDEDEMAGVKFH